MVERRIAPYGSWKSPVTPEAIYASAVGLGQIILDGEDIYWSEGRPSEGGRQVVVRCTRDGRTEDVNPPPYNARTRVHEYGGSAYTVSDGVLFFSNFADGRLYRQERGGQPHPLTPEGEYRYADFVVRRDRGLIYCVREDHSVEGREAANTIVSIPIEGGEARVLLSGRDFYSAPRLSSDGARMCWLEWNHPNMPWDGTELWTAELGSAGEPGAPTRVAGGESEAIYQPEWSPDGNLYFVSDRTGWWNLYRQRGGQVEALAEMDAEFGRPLWQFGSNTYSFDSDGSIVCTFSRAGDWRLAVIDPGTLRLRAVDLPFTDLWYPHARSGSVVLLAASPTESPQVISVDLASGEYRTLKRSSETRFDPSYLSEPRSIEFPTEGGKTAHAFFYPPRNRDFSAPEGEKPPLLVISHGGPTSTASSQLNPSIQFWTSRGIGVLDVNYRGSTGYGREYREALNGQWGVADVDDCVNGARYLVERGEADPERLIIRGGSAGGYTTLCALAFRDFFKAGASYYGVGDLEMLAKDTHKFESRYLDRLVGPYPERKDLYRERSAINYIDRLNSPMIFFQGLEDKMVPPNQSEMMFEALRKKGVPVAYLAYEGEQHGFRKAENLKRSLEAELYFYSKVFGFEPADSIEPVEIENLTG